MKTILIVDDTPAFVKVVEVSLLKAGYRCLTAGDGIEALQVLARTRPDLILLDLGMPRMDGHALLKKLAETPEASRPRIIVVTAMAGELCETITRDFAVPVLCKSCFSLADLRQIIAEALADKPASSAA